MDEHDRRPLVGEDGPASEAGHLPADPAEESTIDDPAEVESLGDLQDPGGR